MKSCTTVRVSNLDFFPPSIIQQSPAANTAGPLMSFDVTFDDPIDATTFSVEDVQIISPAGSVIVPRQVTSADGFTWTVALDPQALAGVYRLTIGPEIADTSGNLMSQGGTFVDGQSLNRQPYVSAIAVGESASRPYPWSEGFESGSLASLAGWSFATTGSGTWRVTSSDNPQAGGFHLRAGQVAAGPSTQEAVLKLDLASQAGAADLSLDFWMTRLGHSTGNFSVLSISGDDQAWSRVYSMAPQPGQPVHYVFDLDAMLTTSGVLLDADVYLKFEHTGDFSNDTMFLDELRVGNSDFFGPSIVSQSLNGQTPDPVAGLSVSFDQEIDATSFSAADVAVIDPLGNAVPLASDPVDGGDGLTFAITFAQPQVIPGAYRFAIGPDVTDEAGNAMNQDGDPNNGETNGNDTYFGQFRIGPPAPAAFPAQEDFEAGDVPTLNGWSFSVTGTGSWDVTDNGSPHAGVYHLRAEQGEDGTSSQQAVFAVDLSGQAADAEIYLDYWAGNSRSTVLINGATTATAVDGSQSTNLGGLLALPSNIGTFQQDEFAVIPEFGVRLSYSVCRNLTASAGYTFLYWSRLLRSSEQIDTNIDVSQLPPAIPAGAVRPEFRPVYSDFWAQGLTFGLEYRF